MSCSYVVWWKNTEAEAWCAVWLPCAAWRQNSTHKYTHTHTLRVRLGVRAKGEGGFLNVKGYLWIKDGERGLHGIHVVDVQIVISLWVVSWKFRKSIFMLMSFVLVKIFAINQSQLMEKNKTLSMCWSGMCGTQPQTFCLCDTILNKEELLSYRIISKEN